MTDQKFNIEKISQLARLGLTKQESKELEAEFGDILKYMDKLKKIDTDSTPPTDHVLGSENITRSDQVASQDSKLIIKQNKQTKNYQIPSVRTLWTS
ncbi:MAG: Asp-tRNA(Asn)/Glu-tRNA(Gln) amidotransferase subunit GatC [bacterium]